MTTRLFVHTHSVPKFRSPDVVLNSSMDQLLADIDNRYAAISTLTSVVNMHVCTGGGIEGEQKCTDFSGYIVVDKPDNINVVLKLPVISSIAFDMVSDGKTFKMKVPPYSCAIFGSDVVTNSSQKGQYALRPAVILDSLLIRGITENQIVSMTQDSRTFTDPKHRKDLIVEPDYDIEFLSQPNGQVASTLRVLHTSRVDLLPYRQDIYNAEGKVATTALYSNYQKFGNINFPSKIEIDRPLDELNLIITLNRKTVFNQPIPSDQFDIDIPSTYTTYNMDDPAIAATVPCAAHATQSPH
jgi:outer membrane lipoprotein-sorting protein